MKKMIVHMSAAMAMLLSTLHAYLEPMPGQLVLSGGYNYTDPRFAASPFVVEMQGPGSTLPNKRLSNSFDTKGLSGAEVVGKYGIPEREGNFLSAKWSTLQGDHVAQVGSTLAVLAPVVTPPMTPNPITVPFAGFARSTLRLNFNDVNMSWNYHLNPTGRFNFYVLGGLEYFQFKSEDKVVYGSTTDTRTYENFRKTDVHGLGARTGADILYTLYAPAGGQSEMSLHIGLSAAALVSQSKTKFNYQESGGGVSFDQSDQRHERVVPMNQFRAGFNVKRYFPRSALALEIGYDVTTYPNLITAQTFTSEAAGDEGRAFDNYSTLALQSLFMDLSVTF